MGMPSIVIKFAETAATTIKNGDRGIIAMILKEATVPAKNPQTFYNVGDIDEKSGLSAENIKQIKLALIGYQTAPKKVVVYFVKDGETVDYTPALNALSGIAFQYLVIPTVETDGKTQDIVSWIKNERDNNKHKVKAVLPNTNADSEGVINFTTAQVVENDTTYTTEKYCSRIAGILAGTPLTISSTYAPLGELTGCSTLSKDEMDAAVDNGKFFVFWDGEKVKTSRAVNSLVTTTAEKNTQFQKIKIVEVMDSIYDDIRATIEDSYIGKYPNTYDNKCLLIAALNNYFDKLVASSILEGYSVDLDTNAIRSYIATKGIDPSELTEQEIREANTGSTVFLKATMSIVDALEDVEMNITI
jgi:hypothetical protein